MIGHGGRRPFCFQAVCLSHPEFLLFTREQWKSNKNLMVSLEDYSKQLCIFNKEVFGDVFKQKARIHDRLDGVQRKLAKHASAILITLERKFKPMRIEIL